MKVKFTVSVTRWEWEGGDGGGAPRGRLSVRRLPGKLEAGEAELGAQVELDRRRRQLGRKRGDEAGALLRRANLVEGERERALREQRVDEGDLPLEQRRARLKSHRTTSRTAPERRSHS